MIRGFLSDMAVCDYTCFWFDVSRQGCVGPKKFTPKPLRSKCEFPNYHLERSPDLIARYALIVEPLLLLNRLNSIPKSQIQAEAWEAFSNLPEPSDLELLETVRGFNLSV